MSNTHHARLSALMRILFAFTRLRPAQMGLVGALSILPLVLPYSVRAQKPQGKGKSGPVAASPKALISAGGIAVANYKALSSRARVMAFIRLLTSSLMKILWVWRLTVPTLRKR